MKRILFAMTVTLLLSYSLALAASYARNYKLVSLYDYEDPNCGQTHKFRRGTTSVKVAYYEDGQRKVRWFKKAELNIRQDENAGAAYLVFPASVQGKTADLVISSAEIQCVQ